MVVGVSSSNGRVPSALPPILKNYTKAAIRTQPGDLITWSFSYFHSLLEGETPPVKEQIEFPLPQSESRVSPGLMRVLHKKLGSLEIVLRPQYEELCQAMGVKDWAVKGAWESAGGGEKSTWDKLLVGLISQETKLPQEQLSLVMQSVSDDVMTKKVPLETVLKYFDLIYSDEDPEAVKLHKETKEYLSDVASFQEGSLIPSDLFRPSCPLNQINA